MGYVRGGMGCITQALARSLREAGGEIRTNAAALRILRDNGRAAGVVLADGQELLAPVVLSNADPYHTFTQLLPEQLFANEQAPSSPQHPTSDPHPAWHALKTRGGASAKINLAVTELPRFACLPDRPRNQVGPEHLGTVHLCPNMDHLERAWDEARQGIPSTEPMIEMYLQTATDPSLAPPGRHILLPVRAILSV